ncbi:hypothetical protein BCR42DRAFT_175715 [Absidia repens]|uniref:Uncharacterized protein n=1 Tax=Absidia repens TaxID=90262 RepID=A0A1X2HZL8_9FUNG|nr:hypothetical protein BCR42DRAFT_175715 [Absidia repens]
MSTPRSSRRAIRFILVVVFCFGVLSWSSSLYFETPDPHSLLTKETQPAASFELSDALGSARNTTWPEDPSTHPEYHPHVSIRKTVPELSFIQRLQIYETQGHNTTSLSQLPSIKSPSSSESRTITTIIHAIDPQSLRLQLDALTTQTMAIHTIWIICTSELQSTAEHPLGIPFHLEVLVPLLGFLF